jgi:hypothetical protein
LKPLDISRPYGCHNREPFASWHFVQDGWWIDGQTRVAKLAQARHVMAKDCRYTLSELGQTDPRCEGCRHRADGLDKPQGL